MKIRSGSLVVTRAPAGFLVPATRSDARSGARDRLSFRVPFRDTARGVSCGGGGTVSGSTALLRVCVLQREQVMTAIHESYLVAR